MNSRSLACMLVVLGMCRKVARSGGLGFLLVLSLPSICFATLADAADDFDAAAMTLNDLSAQGNANFDAVMSEIGNLGGGGAVPFVLAGLGEDFANAADDLRVAAIPEASSALVGSLLAVSTCLTWGIRRRRLRGPGGFSRLDRAV